MNGNRIALKWAAPGWLLLVAVIVGLALRQGPVFDSSILSLLPESEQQPLVQAATEQMSEEFSQRLILVVSGENEQGLRAAVADMAEGLAQLPEIARVYWRVGDADVASMREQLYPYRFSVIDAGVRSYCSRGRISNCAIAHWRGFMAPCQAVVARLSKTRSDFISKAL